MFFSEELLPTMKRRWNVTIFRHEQVEGGIKNVIAQEYRNVRSKWPLSGDVVDPEGKLCFVDESGKEFVPSGVPFTATEVTPAPILDEIRAHKARLFESRSVDI